MPRLLLLLASIVLVAACSGGATPAPTTNPSPTPDAEAMELLRAPANLDCDAMAPGYSSVTFHIDPSAGEPVTVTTDKGQTLQTYWSPGFTGDPVKAVVLGPDGKQVAADGDVLDIPEGAWPRLGGYFVCPSTAAIYVLEQDPS